MEGRLGWVPLKCTAQTLGWVSGDEGESLDALNAGLRFVRLRCRNPRCPDAQRAKAQGGKAYHVFDTRNYIPALGTCLNWPEIEPGKPRKEN